MAQLGLDVEQVTCVRHEQIVVREQTFAVKPRQLVQIIGANGCGKTTLLRAIAGLMPIEHGRICWYGTDIAQARSQYHSDLIYIGHSTGVKSGLTVMENLKFLCALKGKADGSAFEQALIQFGLIHKVNALASSLSAGQKQRIALAQLALVDAKLWLLDEPFTALDKQGIKHVEVILQQHLAREGIVVMTTHQELSLDHDIIKLELTT